MLEKDFTKQIIDLAHLYHWRVAHFRPGQTSRTYVDRQDEEKNVWVTPVQGDGKGFPDCVLVRQGAIIFAELKAEKGKLSSEQEIWLKELSNNPVVQCYVWKPSDFDEIVKVLE